jgi:hypothetical protein
METSTDDRARESGSARRGRLLLAVLLVATAWAYRGNLSLGFTGYDALADVAAARVDGFEGLVEQVWKPVTGGAAGQFANFWRPTTMLHFALLRGLFGWDPLGWQLWDLALHLVLVILVFAVLRAARRGELEALVAAGLFALHPLGVEAVPVVARGASVLCTLFVLLALLAMLRGRITLAFLAGVLALGAKELAVVALPVVVGWAALLRRRREAVTLAGAWALVLLLFLWARQRVLGGWGGYTPTERTFFFEPSAILQTFRDGTLELLLPGWTPQIEAWLSPSLGSGLAVAVLVAVVAGALIAWRRGNAVPLVGLAMVLAALLLYALTMRYTRRLVHLPLAGMSIGLAVLALRPRLRWLFAAWGLTLVPACPLFRPDRDWRLSDAVTRAMTEEVADELARLPHGAVVWVLDLPARLNRDPRRRMLWREGLSVNFTLATYSLEAWVCDFLEREDLELRFLNYAQPEGALDEPQVTREGKLVRVRRTLQGRRMNPAYLEEPRPWVLRREGGDLLLRRKAHDGDEWLLVAGTPRAVLLCVP